ncbi:MAG: hypothetical protein ABUT20_50045 [Bacteroidota bacterium]
MINWNYILVAACLLLIFLLYKEWVRKKRDRLFGRMAASFLALASFLFMAYPHAEQNSKQALKKIILLTDGFIKDSVEDFLHQNNAGIPVFSDASVQTGFFAEKPVQSVTDWSSFISKHADDTIHVFGNGFNKETLASLNHHPLVFHASQMLYAVSHIYWKQYLQQGEPLIVQGHYENNSQKKIKILLQAFDAVKDTALIDPFSKRDFELRSIPLHTGKAIYSMAAVADKDTLVREPVPLDVQAAAPLQLLIISSSPDFENTFLKNHLSLQGYQITVNTVVSTNKTNQQFLNTPVQKQVEKFTVPYLNKFDVLMADEESLQKLSGPELAAVRSSVMDKGTGLLIKMDTQKNARLFYSKPFPGKLIKHDKESFIKLHGSAADSNQFKIKMADAAAIQYTPGTQAVLEDEQSNVYAAAISYGNGRIVATTLQNTYSIALAGDKKAYQQLWWWLLHKAAKKIYPAESWQTNPFISGINQQVQLLTEGNDAERKKASLQQTSIYLRQDELLPFQWHASYWPAANGWQPLPQLTAQSGEWYVYNAADWKQIADYNRMTETKKYAAVHPVLTAGAADKKSGSFAISRTLLALIVFLGSCIFLWVEQKMG